MIVWVFLKAAFDIEYELYDHFFWLGCSSGGEDEYS